MRIQTFATFWGSMRRREVNTPACHTAKRSPLGRATSEHAWLMIANGVIPFKWAVKRQNCVANK
jgi:hypothetical protein